MSFVKLDTGILDSTLWLDRDERDVFVTALLMAEPREIEQPIEQIAVDSLERTGFVVPAGWYGFIKAAGPGIVRRALVAAEDGVAALVRLGSPDLESRTPDHGGRRLVRVDGGYIVLNFMRYRDKDTTAAERAKRYRERQKALHQPPAPSQPEPNVTRDGHGTTRDSSLAEAEAEADAHKKKQRQGAATRGTRLPNDWMPSEAGKAYATEQRVDWKIERESFRDYWIAVAGAKGVKLDWEATWRTWTRRATKTLTTPAAPSQPRKPAGPSETPFEAAMHNARRLRDLGHLDPDAFEKEVRRIAEKYRGEGARA